MTHVTSIFQAVGIYSMSVSIRLYLYLSLYIYIHMSIYVSIYIYIYMHLSLYVYLYVYLYLYFHIYTFGPPICGFLNRTWELAPLAATARAGAAVASGEVAPTVPLQHPKGSNYICVYIYMHIYIHMICVYTYDAYLYLK